MRISDWSSDVCSSDLLELKFATIQSRHPELVSGSIVPQAMTPNGEEWMLKQVQHDGHDTTNFSSTILDRTLQNPLGFHLLDLGDRLGGVQDRKSTRLNSSH